MKIESNQTVLLCYQPDKIMMVKDYCYSSKFKEKRAEIMKQNRSTVYNGFVGPSAGRKLRKMITCWSESIELFNEQNKVVSNAKKKKLVFITLTLSDEQKHDDLFIKRKMLNRFILLIQKKYSVKHYIWKAEKQFNGRMHFHLIVDTFIDMKDVQSEWNAIQDSFGYLDAYKTKFGKSNPPSTHIELYDSSEKAREYAIKYMSKKEMSKIEACNVVKGRVWGCSDSLRNLRLFDSSESPKIIETLVKWSEKGRISSISDDFYALYRLDTKSFLKDLFPDVYSNYVGYYLSIYDELYVKQIPCQRDDLVNSQQITKPVDKVFKPVQLDLFEVDISRDYHFD